MMNRNTKKHGWLMIVGCTVPLLLIIILPFLGITGNWLWFIAIAVMIVAHLYMMRGHGRGSTRAHKKSGGD